MHSKNIRKYSDKEGFLDVQDQISRQIGDHCVCTVYVSKSSEICWCRNFKLPQVRL